MITLSDFASLIDDTEDQVRETALKMMSDYSLGESSGGDPTPKREDFTRYVLEALLILSGNEFEQDGSFTGEGAIQALSEEASFINGDLELSIQLKDRLLELELGEVNYSWIATGGKRLTGMLHSKGHHELAKNITKGLQANEHTKSVARPYMGNATKATAPVLGAAIDELLMRRLPLKRTGGS